LLPWSYRGRENHGDRVAVTGRWILDNGHNVDNQYRTEIHPPLLLASANIVQPADGSRPRTRALFISRPYLSGQTYTTNLKTRYRDDVDDDGPLLFPHFSSHAFNELVRAVTFRSSQIEMHSKIKEKPFRGTHSPTFTVCPPDPRPSRDAQLMVSYRFTTRVPCQVNLSAARLGDGVDVSITLQETDERGRRYQPPALPASHDEVYSNDQLDLLSSGSGDKIGDGELLVEFATLNFVHGLYLKTVFENGIKTDVFDPQPQFEILEQNGAAIDVPVRQLDPHAGIFESDSLVYPVTGWIEVYWATPVIT
jgi:hypothetical protein